MQVVLDTVDKLSSLSEVKPWWAPSYGMATGRTVC
jgi:hypothetical protein